MVTPALNRSSRLWFRLAIGNLLSPVANLASIYGLANWKAVRTSPYWPLFAVMLTIAVSARHAVWTGSRIYEWKGGALSTLRVFWGNFIHFHATVKASSHFAAARFYPVSSVSTAGRQKLGEMPVRIGCVCNRGCGDAPHDARRNASQVRLRKTTEQSVYQALSA